MATQTEKIIVDENGSLVELIGKDKEDFLNQRAKDQAELAENGLQAAIRKAEEIKATKAAILAKLGLTEQEVEFFLS